jgi:hypothetical protein
MRCWGKPAGVRGLELALLIADERPHEVAQLIHVSSATSSPLDLVFEEDERGKRFSYAARWEAGAMKKGDFGEIYAAIIP